MSAFGNKADRVAAAAFALALACVCACVIGVMPAHAATAAGTPAYSGQAVYNDHAGYYKLSLDETRRDLDATGDGVADKIVAKPKATKAYVGSTAKYYEGLTVSVNGKKALDIPKSRFTTMLDGADVYLVTLQNKASYLYVVSRTNNQLDLLNCLYRYKGGSYVVAQDMLKVFDSSAGVMSNGAPTRTYGFRGPRLLSVSGNKVWFGVSLVQSMIGCASLDFYLKPSGAKFVFSPAKNSLKESYAYGKKSLKARRSIAVYKTATGTAKAFTIKKGATVKVSKAYLKNKHVRVYVKVGKKSGWMDLVRCKGDMKVASSNGVLYNKYFSNIVAAG